MPIGVRSLVTSMGCPTYFRNLIISEKATQPPSDKKYPVNNSNNTNHHMVKGKIFEACIQWIEVGNEDVKNRENRKESVFLWIEQIIQAGKYQSMMDIQATWYQDFLHNESDSVRNTKISHGEWIAIFKGVRFWCDVIEDCDLDKAEWKMEYPIKAPMEIGGIEFYISGRIDLLCEIDEGLIIFELKFVTTKSIKKAFSQVMIYSKFDIDDKKVIKSFVYNGWKEDFAQSANFDLEGLVSRGIDEVKSPSLELCRKCPIKNACQDSIIDVSRM